MTLQAYRFKKFKQAVAAIKAQPCPPVQAPILGKVERSEESKYALYDTKCPYLLSIYYPICWTSSSD